VCSNCENCNCASESKQKAVGNKAAVLTLDDGNMKCKQRKVASLLSLHDLLLLDRGQQKRLKW